MAAEPQRYELWQAADMLSFFAESDGRMRSLLAPSAVLIWACVAHSWEEAQALKHEHLGWEPYRPFTPGAVPG